MRSHLTPNKRAIAQQCDYTIIQDNQARLTMTDFPTILAS